jgi:hypothetical protein
MEIWIPLLSKVHWWLNCQIKVRIGSEDNNNVSVRCS